VWVATRIGAPSPDQIDPRFRRDHGPTRSADANAVPPSRKLRIASTCIRVVRWGAIAARTRTTVWSTSVKDSIPANRESPQPNNIPVYGKV